jgi:hypothetical protein
LKTRRYDVARFPKAVLLSCAISTLALLALARCGGAAGPTSLALRLDPSNWPGSICWPPDWISTSITLSTSDGEATVYGEKALEVTDEYASQLAERFGFPDPPVYIITDWGQGLFQAEDSDAALTINQTTGFVWYWLKSIADEAGSQPSLSDDDAIAAAKRYLNQVGLMPDAKLDITVERGESLQVIFGPADIPISDWNPFPKIVVELLDDGKMRRLLYGWQDLKPLGTYPLISQADALERLRQCQGVVVGPSYALRVTDVKLIYIQLPVDPPYEYFVPVYELVGERGQLGTPTGLVLAIADEYLASDTPEAVP